MIFFEQALRWGLGRALTYLQDHPSPEARESVLQALLKSNRVDSQEETGAVYLLEAARLCGLQDDLTPVLMKALHDELAADDDFLTIEQLFDLLGELGKTGDRAARQALVDLVPVLIQHHWHHLPDLTAAIVAALGEQGLKLLLSQVGAAFLRWQTASDNDLLFFVASRSLGEDTETLMESWALEDPGIRRFLQGSRAAHTQWDSGDSNPVPLDVSYEGIWAKLNEGQFHGISYRGEDASEETLLQLARDLQQETDLSRIALLLCVFHLRPFHLGPDFLISLLHHRSRRVKQHALRALTQFEGEAIHELALESLLRPKHRLEGIMLLMKTFRSGDEEVLRTALQEAILQEDEHSLHDFVRKLEWLVEAWPERGMLDLLTEAFPQQPCSFCRGMLFSILAEHRYLSSELILEASLDRNMELRRAAEVHLRSAASLDGI